MIPYGAQTAPQNTRAATTTQKKRWRSPTSGKVPRSTRPSARGTACGCVDAAKKDDASMQQALMELLGFGDRALN